MRVLLNKPYEPCSKTLNKLLCEVNNRGWYTNFGPLHDRLTSQLEDYLGVTNLLLVANGTLALHVAYKTLGLKRAICTPFSYAATATSLRWEKIHTTFVDIDASSLNICPRAVRQHLELDCNIDAIVATHVYGNPCDVDALRDVAESNNIKLIYDAAHAFGVKTAERSVLNYGDASTLSFHATKIFHTVEGGGIVFGDSVMYKEARRMINFGLDEVGQPSCDGINAKLSEYHCAVGLANLIHIDEIMELRASLFYQYMDGLGGYVRTVHIDEGVECNGSYFPIVLEDQEQRNRMKNYLSSCGVQSREYFSPSLNKIFSSNDICPNSESIADRVLCLPLHSNLCSKDVDFVVSCVKDVLL